MIAHTLKLRILDKTAFLCYDMMFCSTLRIHATSTSRNIHPSRPSAAQGDHVDQLHYTRRKVSELLQGAATALLTVGLICEPRWLEEWLREQGLDTNDRKRRLSEIEWQALRRGQVAGDLELYIRQRMFALKPERQEAHYFDSAATVREQFRRRRYDVPEQLFVDFLAYCRKSYGSEGQFPMQHAIRTMRSLLGRFSNRPDKFYQIPEPGHPFRAWMRTEKGVDVTHFHIAPSIDADAVARPTRKATLRPKCHGDAQQMLQF